ncbi:MAG: AtpZ/AtpI family protein [Actinomycetota bacterium]
MTQNRSRLTEHANQSLGSYELVLAAALFGLIGFWLDRRFDTTPAFTIALVILGFVGAGLSIYYRYKAQIDRMQAEAAALRAETTRLRTEAAVEAGDEEPKPAMCPDDERLDP